MYAPRLTAGTLSIIVHTEPRRKAPPMNRLNFDKRVQAIHCLVEGNSIRSTERLVGVHRDTIMRLMVDVGEGCERMMRERLRGLECRRVQVDEIWAFVGKKQKQLADEDDRSRLGDQWTFVAIDADTKLVPTYLVGKRDLPTATAFLTDLSERLALRIQLSSDALEAYAEATETAFGSDVDYGQLYQRPEFLTCCRARSLVAPAAVDRWLDADTGGRG